MHVYVREVGTSGRCSHEVARVEMGLQFMHVRAVYFEAFLVPKEMTAPC